MATQKKTAEVDYSMQEKILALYDLQKIDSQIDSINKVKGELPLEVQDLDDELAGLKARVENINAEIEELNALSKQRKREVDQAKILIGNYKEQQNNVRNNREFDAITKEIEYQELEIELAEKRLKEYADRSMTCTERFGTRRMEVRIMKTASHWTKTIGLRCLMKVSNTASTPKVPAIRIKVWKVF